MLKRRVTRGKAERPSQRANELEQQKLFCVSENVVCPLLFWCKNALSLIRLLSVSLILEMEQWEKPMA